MEVFKSLQVGGKGLTCEEEVCMEDLLDPFQEGPEHRVDLGLCDDSAHCGVWEMQAPRVAGTLRLELRAVAGRGGEWGHVRKYPRKTVSQLTLPCVVAPALSLCRAHLAPHSPSSPLGCSGPSSSETWRLLFHSLALTFPPYEHLLESSASSICCSHKPSLSHANVTWL